MKFEEFTAMLVDCLKVRLLKNEDEAHITTDKILKNNGITLTALNIRKTSQNICPTMYLEPYYREFEKGRSIDEIATSILEMRMRCGSGDKISLEKVLDESNIEKNIVLRVVNLDRNREFLETVPYVGLRPVTPQNEAG